MAESTQREAERGAPAAAVPVGAVLLGKYRVDAILGQGGMGVVAEATHLALGEKVAIKFLRPDVIADEEARQRFLREAQAAVRLKSEHVARVTDVGTLDGGAPYIVMEFLEGVDLEVMVTQSGVVTPALAVDFVLQACEALGEAHALGIVHRDLKPSNFFVTWRADGAPLVKILDFGISKGPAGPTGEELSLTRTQSVLGTPAYMSPEQMRSARTVDARTDLWSLGTVLYELIEGRRPFEAESFSEMCVKVAADPPEPMRTPVPPGLAAAIFRCLEKDPARRFQSVAELAEALAPFARDPREATLRVERVRRTVQRGAIGGVPLAQASALRAAAHARTGLTPQPEVDGATGATGATATELTEVTTVDDPRPPAPFDEVAAEVEAGAPAARRKRTAVIVGVAGAIVAAVVVFTAVQGAEEARSDATEKAAGAGAAAAAGTETETGTETGTETRSGTGTGTGSETETGSAASAVPAIDAGVEIDARPPERATAKQPAKHPKKKPKKRPKKRRTSDDVFGNRK